MSRRDHLRDLLRMWPMRRSCLIFGVAGLLVAGITLPSCGGGAGFVTHPSGRGDLVLQVTTGGGLVPIEFNVTLAPEFSLYGDGQVVVPGPMAEIYPGPALPNLQSAVIPEESIQAILSASREAGLFDPGFDYGLPSVADGPTTTVVINANNAAHRSAIYALGIGEAGGLTDEQQQARTAVSDLVGRLILLAPSFSNEIVWKQYEFSALAVYSRPAGPDPGEVQPNRLDWPLGDLGTLGEEIARGGFRRAVVSGPDLENLRPLLIQATEITLWKSGGVDYRLLMRPLLPNETV